MKCEPFASCGNLMQVTPNGHLGRDATGPPLKSHPTAKTSVNHGISALGIFIHQISFTWTPKIDERCNQIAPARSAVGERSATIQRTLTDLLVEWQAFGEQECFSSLAKATSPIIEHSATKYLRRSRFCTPTVVDEIRSRVWDHLRRLHPCSPKERPVAAFCPTADGDAAGLRYVRWLTRRRMLDVVREERRRLQKAPTLTEAQVGHPMATRLGAGRVRGSLPAGVSASDLRNAAETLPQPKRQLVEMLLEGKKQRTIAGVLGVSEATVSRLRRDAFAQLRTMLSSDLEERFTAMNGRASEPPSTQDAEASQSLPLVTIQYETRSAWNLVLERRYRCYAFGCLLGGAVSVTWERKGKHQTSSQRSGTCNFFAPDSETNEFRWRPSCETTFHTVLVPPEYFEGVVTSEGITQTSPFRPIFGFEDHEVENRIRQLGRHREFGDGFSQECRGRLLVLRMLELQGCGPTHWHLDESVFTAGESKRIGEYVDMNLSGGITLAQMAEVPGLSQSHFDRKFHRSFGVTPSRFVAMRRVQRVVDLLRTTDDTVADIAQIAGFCSASHCTNTFRGMMGIPPSRFRAEVLFPKKSQPSAKDNGEGKARL